MQRFLIRISECIVLTLLFICVGGSGYRPLQAETNFFSTSMADSSSVFPSGKASIVVHGSSFTIGDSIESLPDSILELLITDPQCRKTGYEPVSKTALQEIPCSGYCGYQVGNPVIPGDNIPGTAIRKIKVDHMVDGSGTYTIEARGTGNGIYGLDIRIRDNNFRPFNAYFRHIIARNHVHSYQLEFYPSDCQLIKISRQVSASAIQEDLQTVLSLKWLDDKGIFDILNQKLNNAIASINRGNMSTAINELKAFINTVQACSGVSIKKEAADILIGNGQTCIRQLKARVD